MIIFYVGICGTILILIILITLSFIKCNESMENLCNVKKSNNSTELYIDNIEIYFNNIFEKKDNLFYEFLAIIISLVLYFFEYLFEISIIYHFNPIYIMVRDNIYYMIIYIIFIIFNYDDYNEYISLTQFIILGSSEIISLIGFGIYFEIIELRFCGLDTYLKRNISQRVSMNNIDEDYSIDNIINIENDENNNDDSNSVYL